MKIRVSSADADSHSIFSIFKDCSNFVKITETFINENALSSHKFVFRKIEKFSWRQKQEVKILAKKKAKKAKKKRR